MRGTRETFLKESFPNPSKNLLAGYRSSAFFTIKDYGIYALSRGILPAAKLWCIFAEDSRVCKGMQGYAGKRGALPHTPQAFEKA